MERSGISVVYAVWFEFLFYHEEHAAHERLNGVFMLTSEQLHPAYDKANGRALSIGSGLIESGNKHVLSAILKSEIFQGIHTLESRHDLT
jgi:hypothetical protein